MRRLVALFSRRPPTQPHRIAVEIDRERASAVVAEITESQFFLSLEATKRHNRESAADSE